MTSPIQPAHVASSSAATPLATTNPKRRGWWSRTAPVLLLLLIAPLVAEFLLGDVTLASLPALVLFLPLYGGGAVLIREVVRRRPQSLFNPDYAHQHLLSSGFIPALGIAIPWTVHVLSLHVIWSICTPIALVECMFPDRSTTPWLRTPGLIVIAVLYVLGVVATFAVTWAEYRYVASAGRLIGAAIIAVILIIAGILLTRLGRSSQARIQVSRPASRAWIVGIFAAVAASILVVAPWIPTAMGSTLTFLVIEAAAVVIVTLWSRRPGWGGQADSRARSRRPLRVRMARVYLASRLRLSLDRHCADQQCGVRSLGARRSLGRRSTHLRLVSSQSAIAG